MPIQFSYPDPRGTASLPAAYAVVCELNLNYVSQYGRLVVNVYADKAAHDAGKQIIDQVAYPISKEGTPPSEANPAGFPKFLDIIMTPTPADVLSGPTVLGTTPIWEVIQAVVYEVLKTQPEFRDGVVVA